METEWFANTYNKHAIKIWKKNKGKRLVRKLDKLQYKKHDNSAATAYVVIGGGGDEDKERKEKEQSKEESETRAEKNKLWRDRREREKFGIPDESKIRVNKDLRNEKLRAELVCQNCSGELLSEIWQCQAGHTICEHCFDKETFEERKNHSLIERYSASNSSISSQNNMFSTRSRNAKTDLLLSENSSILEICSYVRPKLEKLDFFENTLNIRKDAIQAYSDYNADLEGSEDGIESLKFGAKKDVVENDKEFYNKYLAEECLPPYAASVECENLKPVTLSEIMEEEERQAREHKESNWRLSFDKNKREIDFFANTLEIRKNAIETYTDYSKLLGDTMFEQKQERSFDDSDNNEDDNDSSTECETDTDTDTSEDSTTADCPVCNEPIIERNIQAEKISKLFYSMMEFRNKM